jgi:EmrB/QacA subfamily drug resistance transporter
MTCEPGEVNPRAVLAVLVIGTVLAPLDSSIVNIALPSIAAQFGERLAAVGWVTTAYLLTTASLLLSMGRLGDVWGLRRLYVAGLAIFGLGSLACIFAPSLALLVASRVFQAVGASMIFAAGPALIAKTFPVNRRGWALGYISLAVSLGLTIGPALGGLLVGTFGWPSIFVINIPLTVFAGAVAWRLLPDECPDPEPFDLPGAALGSAALLALLLGLGRADELGFLAPRVLVLVGLALLLGFGFIVWERRVAVPMIDLAIFRSRAFSAGVSAATLSYLALLAVTFTMPFYLMRIRGLDPRFAGLLLTATPIAMALVAPTAGRLSDRHGSRGLATAGIGLLTTGLLGASFLGPLSPIWTAPLALMVIGAGMALFQTPNTAAILRAVPRTRVGIGSAFVAEARNVGMAVGIALAAAIVGARMGEVGLPGGAGAVGDQVATAFTAGMATALRTAAGVAVFAALLSWFGREADPVEASDANQ